MNTRIEFCLHLDALQRTEQETAMIRSDWFFLYSLPGQEESWSVRPTPAPKSSSNCWPNFPEGWTTLRPKGMGQPFRIQRKCWIERFWGLYLCVVRVDLGSLYFGVFEMGSGRLFVDLPGLSWEPRPGLMGRGGRGCPDSLGLFLALKERLMYPLSSPTI